MWQNPVPPHSCFFSSQFCISVLFLCVFWETMSVAVVPGMTFSHIFNRGERGLRHLNFLYSFSKPWGTKDLISLTRESNPYPVQWKHRVLTIGTLGKPHWGVFFFFFFFLRFIIYLWLSWISIAACRPSPVGVSGVFLSSFGAWASHCSGFFFVVGHGSRVLAQLLWPMGFVALRPVGSPGTRDWTCISCIGRKILYNWGTREVLLRYF